MSDKVVPHGLCIVIIITVVVICITCVIVNTMT